MIYLVTWKGRLEQRGAAMERFLQTGARPPDGVKLIGRWHVLHRISGVAVAECDDPRVMEAWALQWNDIFEMDVCPALTDEEAGPLLAAAHAHQ